MARIAAVLVVGLALGGLLIVGCAQSGGSPVATDSGCADCTRMMAKGDGWCNDCDKGMVAGKTVKCESCYKAKTGGPDCTKCAK